MLEAANKQKKISDSVEPNNSISHDDDEPQQQQQPRRQGQSATVTSPSANPPSSVVVVVDGSCSSSNSKFDLAHFEPVRILNNNSTHKTVSLLGHFGNLSRDKFAIIVLEKTAFTEAQLRNSSCREVATAATDGDEKSSTTSSESESNKSSTTIAEEAAGESSYFSAKSHLRTEFVNDIYGNFLCVTDPEVNQLKVTIIYPASEKHISKYSAHARYLVEETADDYRTVTLPHLEQEQLSLEVSVGGRVYSAHRNQLKLAGTPRRRGLFLGRSESSRKRAREDEDDDDRISMDEEGDFYGFASDSFLFGDEDGRNRVEVRNPELEVANSSRRSLSSVGDEHRSSLRIPLEEFDPQQGPSNRAVCPSSQSKHSLESVRRSKRTKRQKKDVDFVYF